MDLLYTLGSGSQWSNNEIRFSIRSAIKNLHGLRDIYIVGEKPTFLQYNTQINGHTIFHIPFPDVYGQKNADGNIIEKIVHASSIQALSDDFIFINDDNYFIKPITTQNVTPFHKGNMNHINPNTYNSVWGKRLGRTRLALSNQGITPLHFDHHAPFPMKKSAVAETYAQFPDYKTDIGLTVKSIYGSIHYADAPVMDVEKRMFRETFSLSDIHKLTANSLYLAHNDAGLTSAMKYFLFSLFPDPSPFELDDVDDKIIDIAQWEKDGKPFDKGSKLFIKYYPNKRNMHKIVQNNNTYLIRKKIDYYLTKIILSL